MRQGIGCVLREAEPGSLDEVRRCLEGWRFACRSATPSRRRPRPRPTGDELLVVELRGAAGRRCRRRRSARPAAPSLALCPQDDAKALSLAARSASTTSWPCRSTRSSWSAACRLSPTFAELRAERRRRAELFAPYRDDAPSAPAAPPTRPTGPRVVLLGKADDHQVQVVAALPPASLTYLESPTSAARAAAAAARSTSLLVTQPGLHRRGVGGRRDGERRAADAARGPCRAALRRWSCRPRSICCPCRRRWRWLGCGWPWPCASRRCAAGCATPPLRRRARRCCIDALTGLYNQGAFLDYLRATGEDRALIGLEPDRLDQLNRSRGYAAGNRALARLGQSLRRQCGRRISRPISAAAASRWRSARPAASSSNGCACRLEATVAEGEPGTCWRPRKACPARGAPAQRLVPPVRRPAAAAAGRLTGQAMYWPPLADRVEPVMKPASSLARNSHAARDLLGLAEAADRDLRQDLRLQHLLGHGPDHLGADIARADRS